MNSIQRKLKIEEVTGAVLVERLMGVPAANPNADELFKLLSPKKGRTWEGPLLELKASYLSNETFSSESERRLANDSCRWNVVKALIAMANASGGCVLLGIVEEFPDVSRGRLLRAVPIDPAFNDETHEPKDIISHVESALFSGDGEFVLPNGKIFTVEGGLASLRARTRMYVVDCPLADGTAVALIVDPIPLGEDLVIVKERLRRGKADSEVNVVKGEHIYYRSQKVASVNQVDLPEKKGFVERMRVYEAYARKRKLTYPYFKQILDTFTGGFYLMKELAENGVAESQYMLGVIYKTGTHLIKANKRQALKWYRAAANQNYPEAELWMSRAYEVGFGELQIDSKASLQFLKRAAEHGEETAQMHLAMQAEKKEDFETAFRWYQLAADRGQDEAEYKIGRVYFEGLWGVRRDYKTAVAWFKKAEAHDNVDVLPLLAEAYEQGLGVAEDRNEVKRLRNKYKRLVSVGMESQNQVL